MKFDHHQTFHPTLSARSKEVSEFFPLFFMLDAFEAVSNISSNIEFEMLDEMLDVFSPALKQIIKL